MDLDQVAEAIAEAARKVVFETGSRPKHLTAHGQALEALPEAPSFEVGEIEVIYDQSFGAPASRLTEYVYTCRVYASRADDRHGHKVLRSFLRPSGDGSIKAAIEVDRTLGGLCQMLRVERVRGYGVYEVAGTSYYGARVEIRVWGRG